MEDRAGFFEASPDLQKCSSKPTPRCSSADPACAFRSELKKTVKLARKANPFARGHARDYQHGTALRL